MKTIVQGVGAIVRDEVRVAGWCAGARLFRCWYRARYWMWLHGCVVSLPLVWLCAPLWRAHWWAGRIAAWEQLRDEAERARTTWMAKAPVRTSTDERIV